MSRFSAGDYYTHMTRIMNVLEEVNIRILSVMGAVGPRNLSKVAQKARLPPTTVYDRVRKLEKAFLLWTSINPNSPKLGLAPCVVLVKTVIGREGVVRDALKLPNYWRFITTCEGHFNIYSLQTIPFEHLSEFQKYLDSMRKSDLIENYELVPTTEMYHRTLDFSHYDPTTQTWLFEWDRWSNRVQTGKITKEIVETDNHSLQADKLDVRILRRFQENARERLSELAKSFGLTLPAIKYRYDKIIKKGLIHDYVFYILYFPWQISDSLALTLFFRSTDHMNRFFSNALRLPFILSIDKILGVNALNIRAYLPRFENRNLQNFLTSLVMKDILKDYTYVRLNLEDIEREALPADLFEDETGWSYVFDRHRELLENLILRSSQSPR